MTMSLAHKAAKRASLPLTAQDLNDMEAIVNSPAAPRALNMDPTSSEAAVVHQLFELGVKRAYELLDEVGYAQMATDPESVEFDRIARARR